MAKATGGRGPRAKAEPTGREIMKRKPPSDWNLRPAKVEFDPKKAYSPEQLAEIGAISIKWTQIISQIDFMGSFILFTKTPFWLRLAVERITSTSSKLEMLRECLERAEFLDEQSKKLIKDTFDHFRTYRTYRNAIIHHSIYDHEKGIGTFITEQNEAFQIMVSLKALTNLYALMCAIQSELHIVDLLFRIETDAQRPVNVDKHTRKMTPYPPTQLREQVIPELRGELARLQKQRKSLPPLPAFPDADLIRAQWEEQASHLDPAETDQA